MSKTYWGTITEAHGPANNPSYTIEVAKDNGNTKYTNVRPQGFRWDELGVDTDYQKMVGKEVACTIFAGVLITKFTEAPAVGDCT